MSRKYRSNFPPTLVTGSPVRPQRQGEGLFANPETLPRGGASPVKARKRLTWETGLSVLPTCIGRAG
jgi:hypothetical protein